MAPLVSTTTVGNENLSYNGLNVNGNPFFAAAAAAAVTMEITEIEPSANVNYLSPQYDKEDGATTTTTNCQSTSSTKRPADPLKEEEEKDSSPSSQTTNDVTRRSSPEEKRSRLVNFGTVEIREYDVGIGACSVPAQGGVPIGISSEYASLPTQPIEDYELDRLLHRRYKLGKGNSLEVLRIAKDERFDQLLSIGISLSKIQKAARECEKINVSRGSYAIAVREEREEETEDDQFFLACLLQDDAIAKKKSAKKVRIKSKPQWWRKARQMNRFFRR